jgi:tetratricopeptide (TPR) repeat protein
MSTIIADMHAADADGKITVHFIVDKTGKVQDVTTTHNDSIPQKLAASIQKAFERSSWAPATLNWAAVNVSLDIDFDFYHIDFDGKKEGNVSWKYAFFPIVKPLGKQLSFFDIEAHKSFFSTAVDEMQKQHYGKAAEYFGECVEIDEFDLDSYYQRAECYQKLGMMDKAFADWSHLTDLGQTKAKQYLKKYRSKKS